MARDPASFWLPTATGKFYPDFVAQLEDGRLLVAFVYKGAHIAEADRKPPKNGPIGALWQRESNEQRHFCRSAEKSINGREICGNSYQRLQDSKSQF